MSILITTLTLFYASGRFDTWKNYGDTAYQSVKEVNVFKDEIFEQSETDFNIAFAIHKMNSNFGKYKVDYTGYLEIKATHITTSLDKVKAELKQLPIRPCTLVDKI